MSTTKVMLLYTITSNQNYFCTFCDWLSGNETEYKQNSNIVYQNKVAANLIARIAIPNIGN